jgi:UDP-glucose 4-epimerase
VKDSQADIGKAARLLGYKPIVTFEQGLKNTVEWYRTTVEAAPAARRV